MKKKRIAFVVNGLYGGGAEKVLQIVLRNFDRARYDITLVNHRQEEVNDLYPADIAYRHILKSRSRFGMFGVKLYNKINLWVYDHLSPRTFRRIYFRERYDVEIAFIEGYATRIVSGGRSAAKIAWVHTNLKDNPWTDIAFRSVREQVECYRSFDHVISVSRSVNEAFDRLFGCGCSSVVYNPVESRAIREMSAQNLPQRDRSVPLFVSVGRLVPQKGYDRLLHAAAALSAEGYAFRIWILGEGSDRPMLEKMIAELRLENVVTLFGFQDNPYPYMAAPDWFVCSSRSEGYSIVIVESLILGTPVITTACAGITDELLSKENSWGIVVGNDTESLTDGLREILKNPELAARYAAKAVERGEMFSLERQMDEIYGIIDQHVDNDIKQ